MLMYIQIDIDYLTLFWVAIYAKPPKLFYLFRGESLVHVFLVPQQKLQKAFFNHNYEGSQGVNEFIEILIFCTKKFVFFSVEFKDMSFLNFHQEIFKELKKTQHLI